MLDEQDIRDRLRGAIDRAGSQRTFAEQHKMALQYVNDVLRGRRRPGQKILDALGVERVCFYREKEGT